MMEIVYLTLLSPLHTGGTTQEGNLLGIARESHTNLPYIPSSTIRGRLRSSIGSEMIAINGQEKPKKFFLFGNEIDNGEQLEQGAIWIGDGSLLWIPVPSLSHGVVWVTSPMLLWRWQRLSGSTLAIPPEYSTNIPNGNVYLKDAILRRDSLHNWADWKQAIPGLNGGGMINHVLVLPDKHCATIVQMSLWRQVKVKLNEHKTVEGGFRYEEAIPPDTIMYFPWGITAQANGMCQEARNEFTRLLQRSDVLQIGGQESLGRGFVQLTFNSNQDIQAGAS